MAITENKQFPRIGLSNNPFTNSLNTGDNTFQGYKFVTKVKVYEDNTNVIEQTLDLRKSPTNGLNQYFNVGTMVGEYLSYNFSKDILSATTSGTGAIKRVEYIYGESYISAGVEVENLTNATYDSLILNGGQDRRWFNENDFESLYSTESNNVRLLTNITERYISSTDNGYVSFLNGRLNTGSYGTINTRPCWLQVIGYDSNNSTTSNFLIYNPHYLNDNYALNEKQRVDMPVYPVNLEAQAQAGDTYTLNIFNLTTGTTISNVGGFFRVNYTSIPSYLKVGHTIWIDDTSILNGYLGIVTNINEGTGDVSTNIPYNATFNNNVTLPFFPIPSNSFLTNDLSYYKIRVWAYGDEDYNNDIVPTPSSFEYTFNVDNNTCSNKFGLHQFSYMNNFGAFDFVSFKGRIIESKEYNRQIYRKNLGGLNNEANPYYEYSNQDFEITNYLNETITNYELRTDWINETKNEQFLEMLSSTVVFRKIDGEWIPQIVTVGNVDKKTVKGEKLISYVVTLTSTYNEVSGKL